MNPWQAGRRDIEGGRRGVGGVVVAGVLLGALLTGCTGAPPAPDDFYYRLLLPTGLEREPQPRLQGRLVVPRFRSDGILGDRAIAHAAAARPQELLQYAYHFWSAPPPELLQVHAADFLRARGLARAVLLPEVGVDVTHEVLGRIRRLEHLTGPGETASVSLELGVLALERNELLLLRTYDASVPVPEGEFAAVAEALNQAIDAALAQFAADLATLTP